MASGSSRASGRSAASGRRALRMPPSTTTWATWMPCGRELAGHALGEPAQRELAHGERRRLGIALHARRRAREQDGAAAARQHAARRLLRHQEAAERRHQDRFLDLGGIEVDERPAGAVARIVDDDIRRAARGRGRRTGASPRRASVASQAKVCAPSLGRESRRGRRCCAPRARSSCRRRRSARAIEALRPEPAPTINASCFSSAMMQFPSHETDAPRALLRAWPDR